MLDYAPDPGSKGISIPIPSLNILFVNIKDEYIISKKQINQEKERNL